MATPTEGRVESEVVSCNSIDIVFVDTKEVLASITIDEDDLQPEDYENAEKIVDRWNAWED